jgi:hypothetical protein
MVPGRLLEDVWQAEFLQDHLPDARVTDPQRFVFVFEWIPTAPTWDWSQQVQVCTLLTVRQRHSSDIVEKPD